jgi:cation-transporting P-type ATPase C
MDLTDVPAVLLDAESCLAAARTATRQNYGMSIAVNTAGLLVSAGGALSPVPAAILHNASSVAVMGTVPASSTTGFPVGAAAIAPE